MVLAIADKSVLLATRLPVVGSCGATTLAIPWECSFKSPKLKALSSSSSLTSRSKDEDIELVRPWSAEQLDSPHGHIYTRILAWGHLICETGNELGWGRPTRCHGFNYTIVPGYDWDGSVLGEQAAAGKQHLCFGRSRYFSPLTVFCLKCHDIFWLFIAS